MNKLILLTALIIYSSSFVLGQGRKIIKNEEIKTKIEWKYIISENSQKKIKKELTRFDSKGNKIEIIEYEDNGRIKKRKTQKFNDNNDLILKTSYLPNGKINKKTVYKYKGKLEVSKTVYNGKDKLISKKEYEYLKE